MKVTAVLLAALFVCGCGISPYSVIRPNSLQGDRVILFEQSDRLPKDALIESIKDHAATNAVPVMHLQALSPEVIAEIVKQVIAVAPEFSKVYSNERMNEAMIGRRILIRGYGTNELDKVVEIIRALEGCFEKWTQSNR